jgi:hypothetical protein
MRGHIRTIKPEIFSDEALWDLALESGLPLLQAFAGLWCFADREGRFEWRPRALKTLVLPYWQGDFDVVLRLLEHARCIVRYEVDGRSYGYVRNWHKHQRPNHRELPSALPPPPESTPSSPRHHAVVAPSSPVDDFGEHCPGGTEGNGTEGNGKGMGARREDPPSTPPVPGLRRVGGVSRAVTMPSEAPPKAYLDAALMAGVSREQAAATWEHYWTKGLPPDGVEKLHPWLVKQAKERANQLAKLARASPAAAPDRLTAQAARVEMLRARESQAEEAQRKSAP